MQTKLNTLKQRAAAGDWHGALSIAAKFGRLGEQRNAILDADMAIKHPSFTRQIKKDPQTLIDAGIAALKSKFDI